jgi:hypothetical protein
VLLFLLWFGFAVVDLLFGPKSFSFGRHADSINLRQFACIN